MVVLAIPNVFPTSFMDKPWRYAVTIRRSRAGSILVDILGTHVDFEGGEIQPALSLRVGVLLFPAAERSAVPYGIGKWPWNIILGIGGIVPEGMYPIELPSVFGLTGFPVGKAWDVV